MFGRLSGFAILAEGRLKASDAMTFESMLHDRPKEVAVVIGSIRAGRDAGCAGATREPGPAATGPVRFGARLQAGALAALRRDHAPAA